MPTSPIRNSRSAGFTLMEMLVVLAVIALLTALALPMMGNGASRFDGQRQEARIAAAVAQARDAAIASGRVVALDPTEISTSGVAILDPGRGDRRLLFYPDGSSNGGQIIVDRQTILTVDRLTARANATR